MTENKPRVYDLTCNHRNNPIGVETTSPLLSWKLSSDLRDQYQKAYRIVAASDELKLSQGVYDLWDTGVVQSNQSVYIQYSGQPLSSRDRCFWKVMICDGNDNWSDWSDTAFFEMGLLEQSDWRAKWIGINSEESAPYFRKEFTIEKAVKHARIYISGLGFYELRINGAKVGDSVLSPPFTRYDQTCLYDTLDVTPMLTEGRNAIGVILGNGWYNCFTQEVWSFWHAPWKDSPKLILQLYVAFTDGTSMTVCSDTSWKATCDGPITFNALRNGEFYDARKELAEWDMPGFDDSGWSNALIVRSPGGILRSNQMEPIRVVQTIRAVSYREVSPGVYVYDLGRNISGWAHIKVNGVAGQEIKLTYSERIDEQGRIDRYRIAKFVKSGEFQTDKYVMKGEANEEWEPRFVYHGFRYIEVTGLPEPPSLDSVSGRVAHTDLSTIGGFECSSDKLNRLQELVRWSTLTNYHGMPTDCPHREKNGWTGDAQLSAEQVLMNFDPVSAYRKWLADFRDVQRPSGQLPGIVPTGGWGFNWGSGPAWDSALILIPWYVYLYSGDVSIIEDVYDNMKAYLGYMTQMSENHLVDFGLGDWCHPKKDDINPRHSDPDYSVCPEIVTDTAYYYVDALILSKMATLLGKDEDAAAYGRLASDIKKAFRDSFIDSKTGVVKGNCQTSMACALYQGLTYESDRHLVFDRLVEAVEETGRHIDCGILGAKYVMHTLSEYGRSDLAFDIATNPTYPGWGYWLEQGATTFWESWAGGSSRNHHMFSDIGAWFYKALAGINPDEASPGFKNTIFRPNPVPELSYATAWHETMYGTVKCSWRVEGTTFYLNVSVPMNCTATVMFPRGYDQNIRESEGLGKVGAVAGQPGGQPVGQLGGQPGAEDGSSSVEGSRLGARCCGQDGRGSVLQIGSGEYQFAADIRRESCC